VLTHRALKKHPPLAQRRPRRWKDGHDRLIDRACSTVGYRRRARLALKRQARYRNPLAIGIIGRRLFPRTTAITTTPGETVLIGWRVP